ncbi:hypothetical protein BH09PSE2_BH09PSE2_05800 [soil metagenome]
MLLSISLAWQFVISPRRRQLLGDFKFLLAAGLEAGLPLFGVIVLRAGWRHAFIDAGRGWWTALWLSLFWMIAFLIVSRLLVRIVPPFSWLMRDWRRARTQGFKMMFGFGGPRPDAAPESAGEPRFVGRSSFVSKTR